MPVSRQSLSKQAMRLRHPTFSGGLSDEQKQIVGEAADLLQRAGAENEALKAIIVKLDGAVKFAYPDDITPDAKRMFDRIFAEAREYADV